MQLTKLATFYFAILLLISLRALILTKIVGFRANIIYNKNKAEELAFLLLAAVLLYMTGHDQSSKRRTILRDMAVALGR